MCHIGVQPLASDLSLICRLFHKCASDFALKITIPDKKIEIFPESDVELCENTVAGVSITMVSFLVIPAVFLSKADVPVDGAAHSPANASRAQYLRLHARADQWTS
jgi:hypothetical protein